MWAPGPVNEFSLDTLIPGHTEAAEMPCFVPVTEIFENLSLFSPLFALEKCVLVCLHTHTGRVTHAVHSGCTDGLVCVLCLWWKYVLVGESKYMVEIREKTSCLSSLPSPGIEPGTQLWKPSALPAELTVQPTLLAFSFKSVYSI